MGFTKIIHLVEHMFRETIESSFAGELRNFYEYCQFQKSILIIIISSRFILNPYQDNLEKTWLVVISATSDFMQSLASRYL